MPGKYLNGPSSFGNYSRGADYGKGPQHLSNYQPSAVPYQPSPKLFYSSNGSPGQGPSQPAEMFSADHLVTWSVGSENGVLTHEDGMRQLTKMEQERGIFTMRCVVAVESSLVRIVDSQTGETMENFPVSGIKDPVAVTDKSGMFNNIALFTVIDDPRDKQSSSEMHIFQIIERPARELADTIADAIQFSNSQSRSSSKRNSKEPSPASYRKDRTDSNGNLQQLTVQDAINKFEHQDAVYGTKPLRPRDQTRANRKVMESELETEEDIRMGVGLLNRCFDDVERFVLRLKQCAKALHELSDRKKHSKNKRHGNGMLTMRSRAPSPAEFAECFQKIKLSFNLLARLRSYLHNPNATELVHFLFTPLSLLVEASNDPRFDIHDLVRKVVTPLLSKHAVDLLENCLTSKEYDFWMCLGEAWRTPRNQWAQGQIREFRPRFSDGFQPSETWLEMFLGNTLANLVAKQAQDRLSREPEEEPAQHYNGLSSARDENDLPANGSGARPTDLNLRSPISPVSTSFPSPPRPSELSLHVDRNANNNTRTPWDEYQKTYLYELQMRNAKIYEVVQERKGNNSKELSIRKGEIIEVLDDARNWWKCANINGDQGFVPYTLLRRYESAESSLLSPSNAYPSARSTQSAIASPPPQPPQPALVIPAPPPPPPLPPPTISEVNNGNWKLAKKPPSLASKASKRSDEFNSELRQRLSRINLLDSNIPNQNGGARRLSSSLTAQVFIDEHSSAEEVTDWLQKKGFQERTQRVLAGYTGKELFQLSNKAFTGEFGQQEGSRLVSQIKLMKTNSGYTQSGSSQLLKILERQKQRADDPQASQRSGGISDDSDDFPSASMVRPGSRLDAARHY
ncbi:hypothetical protein EB796_019532 [Bugula neritina]|uniref:SH3 domain-containing protein n=1 Tax=Bugula neritina TaxID=10212 RepID=A0A7J7J7G0_BUGNE|nr:hypothetical protein EB796_019532 [Bugula neritina]